MQLSHADSIINVPSHGIELLVSAFTTAGDPFLPSANVNGAAEEEGHHVIVQAVQLT